MMPQAVTLKCVLVAASRRFARISTSAENHKRQNVVILGTGWGSYSCLKNLDRSVYHATVISMRNHFLFTPLLCSTTVGTLEFRSIIEPIRNTRFESADQFHLAEAVGVDLDQRFVKCRSVVDPNLEFKVNYDRLVIGVGALPNTFGVPGVEEHAFFLKELSDARRIRNRLLDNIELAVEATLPPAEHKRLLHVIIVGGGPTGVEFGAELHDFVSTDLARIYKHSLDDLKVSLIEASQVLSAFDERLRQYAEQLLEKRPGFKLIHDSVVLVEKDAVTLKSGERIPCGLVVWSTGVAARDFTKKLNVEKTKRTGQILVDNFLRVSSRPDHSVYALGDCAQVIGRQLPCTAQVAENQGLYLAKLLNSSKNDISAANKFPPFGFVSKGMLAYLGDYKGLAGLHPSNSVDVHLSGVTSWLVWRSAYLTKLGSWRLRFQVPFDWTKAMLFGRDVSRF